MQEANEFLFVFLSPGGRETKLIFRRRVTFGTASRVRSLQTLLCKPAPIVEATRLFKSFRVCVCVRARIAAFIGLSECDKAAPFSMQQGGDDDGARGGWLKGGRRHVNKRNKNIRARRRERD